MKVDMLQSYTLFAPILRMRRRGKIVTIILCAILYLRFCFRSLDDAIVQPLQVSLINRADILADRPQARWPNALRREDHLDREGFYNLPITGYVNKGDLDSRTCEDLRLEGEIQVQNSWFLRDDLEHIARTLESHPMVDYSVLDPDLTFQERVDKAWARLAGSSVWIEKLKVFLTVTRIIFYNNGVIYKPAISFLAGQLHDENWNELKNYTIQWQGEEITFPTIFNIPAPYKLGETWFGPEDPRVILEEGVEDAEPIVIFNMIYELTSLTRAMHIFRPFSNDTTILSIAGQKERPTMEKNWAPFFVSEHEAVAPGQHKWPSHYIHFIYDFNPLTVLRCHTLNGWCDYVYKQNVSSDLTTPSLDKELGRMSGGTNMVRLRLEPNPDLHVWVGFPRSHIDIGCADEELAMYRPELMIMTAHNSTFYLHFMSDPIDFGTAALTEEAIDDPCGEGEVLIANSIVKWDRAPKQDILTLTLSVADSTVQILQLANVHKFIEKVLRLDGAFHSNLAKVNITEWDLRYSTVGKDVLDCTMEAASYSAEILAAPFDGLPKEKLLLIAELEDREREAEKQRQSEKQEQGQKKGHGHGHGHAHAHSHPIKQGNWEYKIVDENMLD